MPSYYYANYSIQIFVKEKKEKKKECTLCGKGWMGYPRIHQMVRESFVLFFYILSNKIIKFFPTFSPIRVYLHN